METIKKGLSWVGQMGYKAAEFIYNILIKYGFNAMITYVLLTILSSVGKLKDKIKDIREKIEDLQSKLGKVEDDDYAPIFNGSDDDLYEWILNFMKLMFPESGLIEYVLYFGMFYSYVVMWMDLTYLYDIALAAYKVLSEYADAIKKTIIVVWKFFWGG